MKFFLYGDNVNPTQLKRRAPEHQFVTLATLPEHTIRFCRWSSQWRCGLATIVPSPGERVWGAVFEVTDEDLKLLDQFENDVPQGAYRHVQVTVLTEGGEKMLVTTYAANPIVSNSGRPTGLIEKKERACQSRNTTSSCAPTPARRAIRNRRAATRALHNYSWRSTWD